MTLIVLIYFGFRFYIIFLRNISDSYKKKSQREIHEPLYVNSGVLPTPLIISFYCIFKQQFFYVKREHRTYCYKNV